MKYIDPAIMLLSIITVTYNAEKVIGKTLESLNQQTFRDFEHIIIDGKSSDATIDIVNGHKVENALLVSEPDKGLYDAMNKGLSLAKGKYVLFLNAGDTFHSSESLEHYMKAAGNDPDIVYADTAIVDSEGNYIGRRHLSVPGRLTHKSFAKGMLICHQAFMVKRSLTSDYNLDYRFSSDYDWCIRCIKKSSPDRCINLKSVEIDYLSEGLTDKNKISSLKERFRIMSTHYGLLPTVFRHISFLPRALIRKLKSK